MEAANERAGSDSNSIASIPSTTLMPAHTPAPTSQHNGNEAPDTPALLRLIQRITAPVVEFLLPPHLRQEYHNILKALKPFEHAHIVSFVAILVAVAEYQQPGWFPRPNELSVALVGFVCASALIFPALVLIEYEETHTWPWDDEGFVWPWQKWLWSGTVYNDETINESLASYRVDHFKSVASLFEEEEGEEGIVDFGRSGFEGKDAVEEPVQSTTPEGSPARPEVIIPPTPCLPGGLRPISLPPPPPTHSSGLLGESPPPIRFKHFSGLLQEECD